MMPNSLPSCWQSKQTNMCNEFVDVETVLCADDCLSGAFLPHSRAEAHVGSMSDHSALALGLSFPCMLPYGLASIT